MRIIVATKSQLSRELIPLAYIYKDGEATTKLVCADISEDAKGELSVSIDDNTYEFRPYLYKSPHEKQSIRVLIFGPQGSGKSYLAGELLDQLFADNPKDIMIIARNTEDAPLDRARVNSTDWKPEVDLEKTMRAYEKGKLEPPETIEKFSEKKGKKYKPVRVNVYDQNIQNCQIESFNDTYLVFDDVERMKDKQTTEYCHSLRDSALEVGRKLGIDCINILHNIKGGIKTSVMRDESSYVFVNPNASGSHKARAFLRDYCAFDKHEIEMFMGIKGRFGMVRTEYPRAIIAKNIVQLI